MTDPKNSSRAEAGEVLISGLDTGSAYDERRNQTPTDKLIGLEPEKANEPEDEDG